MDRVLLLFGEGKELTALQMSCRGIVIFLITLVLIRISGRRSFGIKTALDNIIVILLGALLSRALVGVSPFVPIVAVSFVIVLLHRVFAWCIIHSELFGKIAEGEKVCLYKDGEFLPENMNRGLVSKDDILQGIREAAQTNDMREIDTVYIERNGEISVIKVKKE